MDQAIADAGLTEAEISNARTGIIMGSGGPSTHTLVEFRRHHPHQGAQARRSLRRAEKHVFDSFGDACGLVQD